MPLPFTLICDLLEECCELCRLRKSNWGAVSGWFSRNRDIVDAHDTNLSALLSTLMPEKRTDRVYCIQAPRLEKIVGRSLGLGSSRINELALYKRPGLGLDLGDCVQRVLNITPNSVNKNCAVTVEEIDETLHALASNTAWSSPTIRASQSSLRPRNQADLGSFYLRLSPVEAKWFTRLVLKDFRPLIIDSNLLCRLCDPILPFVLRIQQDFAAAVNIVQSARANLLPSSSRQPLTRGNLLAKIKPQLGIKVGRQHWLKGRSIKNCLHQGRGRMSVEEKVDGEYCQIHVDLTKGMGRIQIFSKSGKDSTEDRQALHSIIKDSLRIGKPGCTFTKACILEGELVVYSDLHQKILPFHKIRNHVTRRGLYLNAEQDSLPNAYEHLMIVYYDILLLDDESLLGVRHSERLKILARTVEPSRGWAELVRGQTIDFGHGLAASHLRKAFADTITRRTEGLVLKPDDPYFDFSNQERPTAGICIKFKKEYIGEFGDIGDFAAVGAAYDSARANTYKIPNLKWTHFYIGCLDNREEVQRWSATPEFTVIGMVELNEAMLKSVVQSGNPSALPLEDNTITKLNLAPGVERTPRLTAAFANPLVFDIRCFSFDKAGNTGFWSPRFPAVSKVHFDRDWRDTVSFEDLQNMAKQAKSTPELDDSQENLRWIVKLEQADPKGRAVDAMSQLTASTVPTPSPRRSTQSGNSHSRLESPSMHRSVKRPAERYTSLPAAAHGPLDVAEAGIPLITPPTSSLPQEQVRDDPASSQKKRSTPSTPTKGTPQKRRRSERNSGRYMVHSPPSLTMSQPGIRKPLSQIDGNSQSSSSQKHIVGTPKTSRRFEVIDLTSSPEKSFSAAKSRATPSQNIRREATSPSHRRLKKNLGAGPKDNEALSTEGNLRPLPKEQVHDLTVSDSIGPEEDGTLRCQYANTDCQFANNIIHLHPKLQASPSIALTESLLAHGIRNSAKDILKWMEDHDKAKLPTSKDEPAPKIILLVDSLGSANELAAISQQIKEKRQSLSCTRRDWITIYDWRVLEYITIMEDDTITKKYYDGFSNPWRRWYCGIA